MGASFLGLRPFFACLDALIPRMTKLGVTSTSAVSEPRTTVTTATNFPRFLDDAAFGAYVTECRRSCWCVHVVIGQSTRIKTRKQSLSDLQQLSTFIVC